MYKRKMRHDERCMTFNGNIKQHGCGKLWKKVLFKKIFLPMFRKEKHIDMLYRKSRIRMKKKQVIWLFHQNGKCIFYDEKEEESYESSEVLAGVLKKAPGESFMLGPKSGKSATIVMRSSHTKALALIDGEIGIGTKKGLPKEARGGLNEGDIFFCAWIDPYQHAHLLWIEHMKKRYQNCKVTIAGYDVDEASGLMKQILKAMLQARAGLDSMHKDFLEKELSCYGLPEEEQNV